MNENKPSNVSFKFTKTAAKALTGNKLEEERDFVTSVDKNEIKSTILKPQHKELVIPLIKKNHWRVSKNSSENLTEEEKQLKDLAVQELIKESTEKNEQWENRETGYDMAVPLIMQNKVPEGYETDAKMDVSLRAEESTLEDYESVPIEQYGLAMLRGMGWKEGDGIGANNKMCVKPIEAQLRPKGLGLGADASVLKKNQKKAKEEKLELLKGAYVNIVQGSHKGFYGQVLGLDEENARAIVKLSSKDKTVTFPEFYICVVSKKEFDKESKVINRATYESYKREQEERDKDLRSSKSDRDLSRNSKSDKRRDRDYESQEEEYHKKEKSKKPRQNDKSHEKYESESTRPWVRPQLRVRCIDDKYKKGRYFSKKMIVVDVLSSKSCCCKTEDDKYIDDISPSMLETVIPREDASYVMIVQGKYRGELGTILKRDKSQCIAAVQFLSDRNKVLKIEYDSICEYVGDVDQFD